MQFFSPMAMAKFLSVTFADTLKEILRELDNKLTEDDINNIIEEVDEDGSGTLDFDGNFVLLFLPQSNLMFQSSWR